MYHLRRKLLSQNFFHNRGLITSLLRRSSIGKNDTVLEIGCGRGIITESLIDRAEQVVGLEIDEHWYDYLKNKFSDVQNLTLYREDIFKFLLPTFSYKVFANIPFSIEGKIVRYLIDAKNPPDDCYLVVIKALALRLSGCRHENQFSLLYKPWFDFSIFHQFKRDDFTPFSNVDSVMFRITKRILPLLPFEKKELYKKFIRVAFGNGQPVYQNLKKAYGGDILQGCFNRFSISQKVKPSELSLSEWLLLFQELVCL